MRLNRARPSTSLRLEHSREMYATSAPPAMPKQVLRGHPMSARRLADFKRMGSVRVKREAPQQIRLTERLAEHLRSSPVSEALSVIGTLLPDRRRDTLLFSLGQIWGRADINQAWGAVTASSLSPALKRQLLSALWG
jgi:hypothetical protein